MTNIILAFILLALIPATFSCLTWLLSKQLPPPARIMLASIAGMIVPTAIGYAIFLNEGGNADPDPEMFMWLVIAIAAVVSIAIILCLEIRQLSK